MLSKVFKESKDCMGLSRKDFPVVKELMNNEHLSAPTIARVKLRSFLLVRILMWIPLSLGWVVFWSALNIILETQVILFIILVISFLIIVIYCIEDLYRLKKLKKASLIARRLDTSSVERTFPVSEVCFVEDIPVPTDYLRNGGDIYLVPFLKDMYVVHINISELIEENN